MPRKLFRRFLPSHESIRQNRHISRLGPKLQHHNLWHLHRRSVAGGVAVGLFAGLIPGSNPVQFLAAGLLAVAFKVNLPIAVAVTLYSNPFTIVPLYYIAFKLGQLALWRGPTEMPDIAFRFEGMSWRDWLTSLFEWVTTLGKPLLVGLPLLAVALAVCGYLVMDWAWRLHVKLAWRKRQRTRARA